MGSEAQGEGRQNLRAELAAAGIRHTQSGTEVPNLGIFDFPSGIGRIESVVNQGGSNHRHADFQAAGFSFVA
jgi:hypothetical protein